MEASTVYFRDNFFSSGETDITDGSGATVGFLDLQGMFSSGVTVSDSSGGRLGSGGFRFFSNKWVVEDGFGNELGVLKSKLALFSQRYVYESGRFGELYIESPAFTREYTVYTSSETEIARFRRVDGFFESGAFELVNRSRLPTEELIVVVMGVHAIRKRRQSAAST